MATRRTAHLTNLVVHEESPTPTPPPARPPRSHLQPPQPPLSPVSLAPSTTSPTARAASLLQRASLQAPFHSDPALRLGSPRAAPSASSRNGLLQTTCQQPQAHSAHFSPTSPGALQEASLRRGASFDAAMRALSVPGPVPDAAAVRLQERVAVLEKQLELTRRLAHDAAEKARRSEAELRYAAPGRGGEAEQPTTGGILSPPPGRSDPWLRAAAAQLARSSTLAHRRGVMYRWLCATAAAPRCVSGTTTGATSLAVAPVLSQGSLPADTATAATMTDSVQSRAASTQAAAQGPGTPAAVQTPRRWAAGGAGSISSALSSTTTPAMLSPTEAGLGPGIPLPPVLQPRAVAHTAVQCSDEECPVRDESAHSPPPSPLGPGAVTATEDGAAQTSLCGSVVAAPVYDAACTARDEAAEAAVEASARVKKDAFLLEDQTAVSLVLRDELAAAKGREEALARQLSEAVDVAAAWEHRCLDLAAQSTSERGFSVRDCDSEPREHHPPRHLEITPRAAARYEESLVRRLSTPASGPGPTFLGDHALAQFPPSDAAQSDGCSVSPGSFAGQHADAADGPVLTPRLASTTTEVSRSSALSVASGAVRERRADAERSLAGAHERHAVEEAEAGGRWDIVDSYADTFEAAVAAQATALGWCP